MNQDHDENEQHELYSRFICIPIYVMSLVENGTITAGEAYLLGVIDGFCNHSAAKLCFATNAYLAKRMGLSQDRTRRIIYKMKNLGLLDIVMQPGEDGYQDRRLLRLSDKVLWAMGTSAPGGRGRSTPPPRGGSDPYKQTRINTRN